jgi:hypothetical protein
MKRTLIIACAAMSLICLVVLIVNLGLALAGSRHVMTWLQFFVPLYASLAGMLPAWIGAARDLQAASLRMRAGWTTATAVPSDAEIAARRLLKPIGMRPLAVLAVIPILMLLELPLGILYPKAQKWGALRTRGAETTGIVTNKRSNLGRNTTFFYLDYEFRNGILTIPGSASVSEERWSPLHVGDPVPVTYLPAVPRISLPVARRNLTFGATFFDAKLVMLLGAIVVLFFGLIASTTRLLRRQLHLLRNGKAIIGSVTAIRGSRVDYSFDTPSGVATGRCFYRGSALPYPDTGDQFVVLYDTERPKRNVPWSFARGACERPVQEPPRTAGVIDRDLLERVPLPATPARVKLAPGLYVTVVCLFIMTLPPALSLAFALQVDRRLQTLSRGHRQTEGVVTATSVVPDQIRDNLRVHYRYSVRARTFTSTYVVSSTRLQERFVTGHATPVVYAISDPAVSLPLRESDLESTPVTTNRVELIMMTLVMLVFAGLLAYAVQRTLYEWRIASIGRMAVARVEAASGRVFRRCRYRFLSDHVDVEVTVRIHSKTFRPAPGERIQVLYVTPPLRSMPVADLLFVKRVP